MSDFERKIIKALNDDIEIPADYRYTVRNALKTSKVKKRYGIYRYRKFLATACVGIVIGASLVYAKDIKKNIENIFNNDKGTSKAIAEGYIDNPDMDYIQSADVDATYNSEVIDAKNTEIKVESMLMDDLNLNFLFSIKVDENIDISNIRKIRLPNILITDENNRIIYCENKEQFDKYCLEHNLDYEYLKFNENYINNETSYYIKSKDGNTIDLIYNLSSGIYKYPNSKKLNINITQINMSEKEIFENEELILNGNWDINVDVAEKFYNREAMVYSVVSCSDDKIDIQEAAVYNTGMVFEFTSQDKPIYDEGDSIEVQREKMEIFEENNIIYYVNAEYIENEKGERFYSSSSTMDSSGTMYEVTGKFTHWQTFDLIPSDATNKLYVHFNLNLQGYSRDIVVELERKN